MATSNQANSPTTATAGGGDSSTTIPTSTSTFLAIPAPGGRMARSSSHESFATDVSLLSLSSFTSEIPTRIRSNYDKDDDPDSDRGDQSLAKYREDMFEKMLETHALQTLMSNSKSPFSSTTSRQYRDRGGDRDQKSNKSTADNRLSKEKIDYTKSLNIGANGLTKSEEELLRRCARDEPRNKGSLYKSFSTSDVLSLNLSDQLFFNNRNDPRSIDRSSIDQDPDLSTMTNNENSNQQQQQTQMKSCVSQSWIPNDYARASQRRKKHLEYLKRMCGTNQSIIDDEWNFLLREHHEAEMDLDSQEACTPEASGPAKSNESKKKNRQKFGDQSISIIDNRLKSNSDENLLGEQPRRNSIDVTTSTAGSGGGQSKKYLMKKFNFSKEIGCRIRDDLLSKLNKHTKTNPSGAAGTTTTNMSVTKNDLEREKGRPLTRLERNFIIFHWLQSLDEDAFANA